MGQNGRKCGFGGADRAGGCGGGYIRKLWRNKGLFRGFGRGRFLRPEMDHVGLAWTLTRCAGPYSGDCKDVSFVDRDNLGKSLSPATRIGLFQEWTLPHSLQTCQRNPYDESREYACKTMKPG